MEYRHINYLTIPQKHGQGKDGVQLGPQKLLEFGLHELLEKKTKNITKYECTELKAEREQTGNLRNLKEVIEMNKEIKEKISNVYSLDTLTMNIGGDHSIGLGTIAGVKAAVLSHQKEWKEKLEKCYIKQNSTSEKSEKKNDQISESCEHKNKNESIKIGIIWFDAHPDMNVPEGSPSGNIHGMPLACCCGIGEKSLTDIIDEPLSVNDLFFVGIRSIDEGEAELIEKHNISHFKGFEVQKVGMKHVLEKIKEKFESYDIVHVSFDIDGIDPEFISGTGTPVPDGVDFENALMFLREMGSWNKVHSIDFVEYNPLLEETKTGKNVMKCIEAFLHCEN